MASNDYTRDNVREAARHILAEAGITRAATQAMIDGGVGLPELIKIAAQHAFIEDMRPGGGPTGTALFLVRKACKTLSEFGEFKFEA